MARGNASYSVGLTTSATLLSPLIVPWALKISLQQEVPNFPVEQTFVQLCYMVVGPVILGHCLSHPFEQVRRFMKVAGPIVANLAIIWVIVVIVGQKRAMLTDIPPAIFAVLVIMNACGYACGFFGGKAMRLDRPMRRALTLEVGMQNAGLGAVLASDLFPDTPAAVPTVVYMFGCMLTGTVLARIWAELSHRESEIEE